MRHTPEQQAAIHERLPRLCVSAGAGSGKTRVLVERIVSLLEEDPALDLSAIGAITFTDKAAAEMKARLREEFRRRAAACVGDPVAVSRWRELERRLESGRISTIHSFCLAILRQHALRLGLDPDFALVSEGDAALLAQDTVRTVLHGLLDAGDPAALRLCTAFDLRKVEHMLLELLQHRGQLAPLLPAADEVVETLAAAHQALLQREHARYFRHGGRGWGARRLLLLLRGFDGQCTHAEDGREIRRQNYVRALNAMLGEADDSEARELLRRAVEERPRGSRQNWPKDVYDRLERVQGQCDRFAKKLLEPGECRPELDAKTAEATMDLGAVFGRVEAAYRAAKQGLNVLDFEDAIQLAASALAADESLCREVAASLKHLLVDEFQDTDRVQLSIAERLAACHPGPGLFVVGDAKQSIYAFRGAEVQVFLDAQRGASKVIALAKNFRTRPAVLAFINHFFEQTGQLEAVERYVPMQAGREEAGGAVEFLIHTVTGRAEDCRAAEAELIAGRITELLEGGGETPVKPEDIAILVRRATSLSPYEEALRCRGIPYRVGSGSGFYRLQEVLDVVNCCRVVLDPWDEAALLAFLRGPLVALSDDALVLMTEHMPLCMAFAGKRGADTLSEEEAARLARARELIAELRLRQHAPVAAFLHYLLGVTGLEAIMLGLHHGVQKVANLRKLVEIAEEFSARRPISLHGFIAYVEGVGEGRLREGDAPLATEGSGAVTFLTVHKAKGLEYPVVIIAGAGEKHLGPRESALHAHRDVAVAAKPETEDVRERPSVVRAIGLRSETEDLAEFGRLFYVAMTRARDRLILASGPQPARESWFEAVDLLFGACGAAAGARIAYPGGEILVRRGVAAAGRGNTAPPERGQPHRDAVLRRIAPIPAVASAGPVLSVSVILDHLAHGIDWEEERGAEERGVLSAGAVARGHRVHRLLEWWDMAGDAPIEEVLGEAVLRVEDRAAAREDLAACADRVRQLSVWPLLRTIRREDREIPFLLAVQGGYISGVIDAMTPEGVLVDYKTGRFDERRHARYCWQLWVYAAAVRALRGVPAREGLLVYVDEGRCERVPLGEAEVGHALREAGVLLGQLGAPPGA